VLAPFVVAIGPFATVIAKHGRRFPISRAILDRFGVGMVQHHYYEPIVFPADLRRDLREKRNIVGLNLNEDGQLSLLQKFRYREELLAIPLEEQSKRREYFYHNATFTSGDAEYLYNFVRHFKPGRIVEIGSGYSTLIAKRAIEMNCEEDKSYSCDHVCIEPFEQPWLEEIGARVIRQPVELCSKDLFTSLRENDILFIDSSHVIRPQGDVLLEYLEILGSLAPGVLIHIHDIFTPYDYIAELVIRDRRMWNEQYLLEAFLCFNQSFEVLGAVNWLSHVHKDRLTEACPVLVQETDREPGSFWLRRVADLKLDYQP